MKSIVAYILQCLHFAISSSQLLDSIPLNENSGGCDMVAVARVLLQHPPTREIVAGLGIGDGNGLKSFFCRQVSGTLSEVSHASSVREVTFLKVNQHMLLSIARFLHQLL